MANGWGGADPASFGDPADYELGTHYLAVNDITLTDVRIFGGNASTLAGRAARIWTAAGSALAVVTLPATITPGWTTYVLPAPLQMPAGTEFWVTYSTVDSYGFLGTITYPVNSADGRARALGAAFHGTPGLFPNTPSANGFFGVDVVYTPGLIGNARPVAGLTVAVTGPLAVQAAVTITDESPAACTVIVEWGDGASGNRTGPGALAHTYAAAGVYAVMATVTDAGGLDDSAAVPVEVPGPQTGMALATVMQAISDRLDTIAGLRCHASPPGTVTPPAAIVSYPDKYDYDETYGRGSDRISALPIVVVVGRPTDRSTRDLIGAYVAPTGPSSVKAVLESGNYSAFDELRVTGVEFDVVSIGGVDYLAAIFTLDIVGPGR